MHAHSVASAIAIFFISNGNRIFLMFVKLKRRNLDELSDRELLHYVWSWYRRENEDEVDKIYLNYTKNYAINLDERSILEKYYIDIFTEKDKEIK